MRTDGGTDRPDGDLTDLLESMSSAAVFARDRYLTVVAANARARAVSPALRPGTNLLRWLFLDDDEPRCTLAPDLPDTLVALLHDSLEQHDHDARFRALVGELAARDGSFARIWARSPARASHRGVVGRTPGGTALRFQELRITDDHEVVVVVLSGTATAAGAGAGPGPG